MGEHIVRKCSPRIEYNPRLQKQRELQATAFESGLLTPEILQEGYDTEGRYFFDMRFLPGLGLHSAIATSSRSEITNLADGVSEIVGSFTALENRSSHEPFESKISDLSTVISRLPGTEVTAVVMQLLADSNWTDVPYSMCHGDLTFENMLVHKGRVYLVDFHDVFFSSWVQDISKLIFDLESNWSFRGRLGEFGLNELNSLQFFRERLLEQTANHRKDYVLDEPGLSKHVLLQLARVLPYVTERATFAQLIKVAEKLVTQMQTESN
jgi:thiamine kinase-like enzyme